MLNFPLPPVITKDGEMIIDPGDVDGEYKWIIILDHELLGAVDFDICALRELRDLVDREIAIRTGEIPNTNRLCADAANVAEWWTSPASANDDQDENVYEKIRNRNEQI